MRRWGRSTLLFVPMLVLVCIAWGTSYFWALRVNIGLSSGRGMLIASEQGRLITIYNHRYPLVSEAEFRWADERTKLSATVDQLEMVPGWSHAQTTSVPYWSGTWRSNDRWTVTSYWFWFAAISLLWFGWVALRMIHRRRMHRRAVMAAQTS